MPNAFSADRLDASLAEIPAGEWSEPSDYSTTEVHHGYRQLTLVLQGSPQVPYFDWVLEDFAPVWGSWLSWIQPGGFIIPHQDAGPHRERWQVPIQPAGRATFGAGEVGVPLRVEQWKVHSVWNPTDLARIHLVIDRDVVCRDGAERFRAYPHLIDPPFLPMLEDACA